MRYWSVMARLRRSGIHSKLGVPAENRVWFWKAIQNAVDLYQASARPKGHPDGPLNTARQMQRLGRAVASGSRQRKIEALRAVPSEARKRLEDIAGAQMAWQEKPTMEQIAGAAILGSGTAYSPDKRRKYGPAPPRTRWQLAGGRPPRPEVDHLVTLLAAALAGATGRQATRGMKNRGAGGELIPSPLERLVIEVQKALGEKGQWDPIERVRAHIRQRKAHNGS